MLFILYTNSHIYRYKLKSNEIAKFKPFNYFIILLSSCFKTTDCLWSYLQIRNADWIITQGWFHAVIWVMHVTCSMSNLIYFKISIEWFKSSVTVCDFHTDYFEWRYRAIFLNILNFEIHKLNINRNESNAFEKLWFNLVN